MRFLSPFFIKQITLVLLDMSIKDFEFCRILGELFIFLIDSALYSPPGSQSKLILKKHLLVPNTPGSQDYL